MTNRIGAGIGASLLTVVVLAAFAGCQDERFTATPTVKAPASTTATATVSPSPALVATPTIRPSPITTPTIRPAPSPFATVRPIEILYPGFPEPTPQIDPRPAETEAQQLALLLSGETRPPPELSRQIQTDLSSIRSSYSKDIPMVAQRRFWTPWSTNRIVLGIEKDSLDAIKNGTYHDWDELNREYRATSLYIYKIGPQVMSFDGNYHPSGLTQEYFKLPGVVFASAVSWPGDGPMIKPVRIGDQFTYLFRDAWGDCPAGCIEKEFWYFTFDDKQEPTLAGHWNPQNDPKEPDWWNTLRQEMGNYDSLYSVPELVRRK